MSSLLQECDSYIIDTIKIMDTGMYIPGAVTFKGRKRMDVLQWKDHPFETQLQADAFVRDHFEKHNIAEVRNEEDLKRR